MSIARNGTEILPAIAQRGLLAAHGRNILQRLIKRIGAIETRPSPQRFANGFVRSPSMQTLLRAVINARNTLQPEQTRQAERDLRIEFVFVRWIGEADAFLHIVVIQEGHEKAGCVSMRAQDVLLHLLPVLIHAAYAAGAGETFHYRRQSESERKIQRSIHAHQVAAIARAAADELRDPLVIVEDLPKREK